MKNKQKWLSFSLPLSLFYHPHKCDVCVSFFFFFYSSRIIFLLLLGTSNGPFHLLCSFSVCPQLTPEEEEKRRVRRERNKLAAAKCRNRRRELTEMLQGVSGKPEPGPPETAAHPHRASWFRGSMARKFWRIPATQRIALPQKSGSRPDFLTAA